MTTPTTPTTPRAVLDMPEADYHAHPALSASGAKLLLPPSCPARFHHERHHPPAPKDAFDFGRAAHALALGAGTDITVIDAEDWRTKAAQHARDQARADGKTPLLRGDHTRVMAMADAIRTHPVAGHVFDPDRGHPEVSIFFDDPATAVACRARLDWLPDLSDHRTIIADLKTTVSAEPRAIAKTVSDYGYALQAAWYLQAAQTLGHEDPAFLFVFIEKTPPYLITVAELDTEALLLGRQRAHRARQLYAQCSATDTWPAFSDGIELITLPAWATRDLEVPV